MCCAARTGAASEPAAAAVAAAVAVAAAARAYFRAILWAAAALAAAAGVCTGAAAPGPRSLPTTAACSARGPAPGFAAGDGRRAPALAEAPNSAVTGISAAGVATAVLARCLAARRRTATAAMGARRCAARCFDVRRRTAAARSLEAEEAAAGAAGAATRPAALFSSPVWIVSPLALAETPATALPAIIAGASSLGAASNPESERASWSC